MPANPAFSAARAAVLIVFGFGCAADSSGPPIPQLSHDRDLQPLWDAKCADCHMNGHAFGGLFLDPGHAYENLVGVPASQLPTMARIRPGDPERSYVWRKLRGTHRAAGGYGEPVPVVWTEGQEARILLWIEQGAPR